MLRAVVSVVLMAAIGFMPLLGEICWDSGKVPRTECRPAACEQGCDGKTADGASQPAGVPCMLSCPSVVLACFEPSRIFFAPAPPEHWQPGDAGIITRRDKPPLPPPKFLS